MTRNEFLEQIGEKFLFEIMDDRTLTQVSNYATMMAKEHWPEVSFVTATCDYHDLSIHLDFAFNSTEDAMWWKLKNL